MSELITLQETARRLGVSTDTVRRWSHLITTFPQPVRLPGSNRLRFKVAEVEAYIAHKQEQE
jgi:predicted DNA-binding transcriptional regulator AlpA